MPETAPKCQFCGCPVGPHTNTCLDCARDQLGTGGGLGPGADGMEESATEPDAGSAKARPRRKPASTSPTELTLRECKRREWVASKLEFWQPSFAMTNLANAALKGEDLAEHIRVAKRVGPGVRKDLFGFGDVLAIGDKITIIQTTVSGEGARRIRKICEDCNVEATAWLSAGGEIAVWTWKKNEKSNRWELRERQISLEDIEPVALDVNVEEREAGCLF